MATIVILEHLLQRGLGTPYMVYALAERWRERGHRVLVNYGTQNPPPGDLAILNVDLTVVPEAYRALLARYRCVVNGRLLDISKRRYSENLLSRDTGWTGPVIVKTDMNFGGKPEHLLREHAARLGVVCDIAAAPLAESYPIYRSVREVPEEAWRIPGLVVEKFLPERDERGYYIRMWFFFGDRERNARFRADVPIIKGQHVREREDAPVPEEMRIWRARLGADFGKIEYVRNAGRYELIDVNRTPGLLPANRERAAEAIEVLSRGVDSFLGPP